MWESGDQENRELNIEYRMSNIEDQEIRVIRAISSLKNKPNLPAYIWTC